MSGWLVTGLAVVGYVFASYWVATALGRRIRRVRLAREAWHEAYWGSVAEIRREADEEPATP